ncbi:lysylphosphatidylglycerol synthase transmembrane domain-containing protein [Dactylosporangium sp. NPDC050688]|uniref:lysylphosphatidylglycerol synthase transmembrane domain-containing protein n=1 Tax=Dactylosporangium sp. NPDC050688 TaxID=3157217 RepID=UPI0033F9FA98
MIAWLRRPQVRQRAGTILRWVSIIGTAVALVWFVRGLDLHHLRAAFARTSPAPLVVAVGVGIGSHYVRALGWSVMLGPRYRIPFGRQVRYEFTAQAASALMPARAGEMLRVWLLRRDGVPPGTTAALVGVKKLYEGLGLALLALAAPWLLPGLPGWLTGTIWVFAAAMAALTVALVVAGRRIRADAPATRWGRFTAGLTFLRDMRRVGAAIALAVVGELADLAAVVAVLYALDIDVPLIAAAVILFVVDTSNLFPSAPAHAGTFEVGVLAAFDALGGQTAAAVAFALIFHTQQVVSQIVVGVPFLLSEMLTRRRSLGPATP